MGVNASIEGSNPSFSAQHGGNHVSPVSPLLLMVVDPGRCLPPARQSRASAADGAPRRFTLQGEDFLVTRRTMGVPAPPSYPRHAKPVCGTRRRVSFYPRKVLRTFRGWGVWTSLPSWGLRLRTGRSRS